MIYLYVRFIDCVIITQQSYKRLVVLTTEEKEAEMPQLTYEEYLLLFLEQHPEAKAKLIKGGLFDPKWMNVVYHNAAAGVGMQILCNLMDISNPNLVFIAATHDWDKRITKKQSQLGTSIDDQGHEVIQYDVGVEIRQEQGKIGILRITGNDLRDYMNWTLEEVMLRYIDSCLGINEIGQDAIINWRTRIEQLRVKHTDVDRDVGNLLYGGQSFYDILLQITRYCEDIIYEKIKANNPPLANHYPDGSVWRMLSDAIASDIAAS